ncbi:MAG: branched-chain amino acid transport system II carrier protein [Clostridium sp.]
MNKSFKDVLVVGFALFAMFFGAGNLIFPPSLGLAAGQAWFPAMIGFLITGIGLPLLGIIAASKAGGSIEDVGNRVNKTFSKVFAISVLLAIGPLFAIPRTAATTFEIGVAPFVGEASTMVVAIVSIIFFAVTIFFAINPSTVIDKVGKVLTPFLLIALLIIIFRGIVSPAGTPIDTGIEASFGRGFVDGYNTMDALASMVFAGIVIGYFIQKGYTDIKSQVSLTIKAGIVSAIGFVVVYGGLTYLGATVSGEYPADISQTKLTIEIVRQILGQTGQSILSVAVALACLTTSVGLTATCADYFSKQFSGKLGYKALVIIISVFSCVVSIFGVSTIVSFSVPILILMYPIVTVLMILTVFDKIVVNNNMYKGAVIGAFAVSIFEALTAAGMPIEAVNVLIAKIPLAGFSLSWVIPSIIGMLIAMLFKPKKA